MIFKVFFLKLLTWVIPFEMSSINHFASYYFKNINFDSLYVNRAYSGLLLGFILFLYKDIYKLLKDFFIGLYLFFYIKRDLNTIYERNSGFIEFFYLVFLFLLKVYLPIYRLDIYNLSLLFVGISLFSLIPMFFKFSNKKGFLNIYLFPLLFLFSLLFSVEGVSVLFLLIVFFRLFSVDKLKANQLAFLSLFTVFLVEILFKNNTFIFDYIVLIFIILTFVLLYLVNILLKRQNIYEISVFYALIGVWTILDLLFS